MAVERAKIDVEERDEGVAITLLSGDRGNYLGVEELAMLTSVLDKAEETGRRWILLRQHGQDFCLAGHRAPAVRTPGRRSAASSSAGSPWSR